MGLNEFDRKFKISKGQQNEVSSMTGCATVNRGST